MKEKALEKLFEMLRTLGRITRFDNVVHSSRSVENCIEEIRELNKTKPIVIIRFPPEFTQENIKGLHEHWKRKEIHNDYYLLAMHDQGIQEITVQVFFEKDFTEIKYQELLNIIQGNEKE